MDSIYTKNGYFTYLHDYPLLSSIKWISGCLSTCLCSTVDAERSFTNGSPENNWWHWATQWALSMGWHCRHCRFQIIYWGSPSTWSHHHHHWKKTFSLVTGRTKHTAQHDHDDLWSLLWFTPSWTKQGQTLCPDGQGGPGPLPNNTSQVPQHILEVCLNNTDTDLIPNSWTLYDCQKGSTLCCGI